MSPGEYGENWWKGDPSTTTLHKENLILKSAKGGEGVGPLGVGPPTQQDGGGVVLSGSGPAPPPQGFPHRALKRPTRFGGMAMGEQ